MKQPLVDTIVNAVLYEGYILYPYRPSSKKNRQRFSFGRVYPKAYNIAQEGAEPCMMQTECIVLGSGGSPAIHVQMRFLHPSNRDVGRFLEPAVPSPDGDSAEIPAYELVPELRAGGKMYQPWQEVTERHVDAGLLPVEPLVESAFRMPFSFSAGSSRELILDGAAGFPGVLIRTQEAVAGVIEITACRVDFHAYKISVRIFNGTSLSKEALENQDAVVMRTFTSTHTILNVEGGEFVSLTDPPAGYSQAAAFCKNIGTWPVLVGEEKKGERDTLLSSPIILYDYPQIAPESPGDLHDGTEIDEILTLRIMTMTDEEKLEMRHVDDYARRILERTETLPDGDLWKMHGVMRGGETEGEDFFNPTKKLKNVRVSGVDLKTGDRVRIRPKARADAMDMALAGKVAVIEAIEEDAEEKVHLALVLDDDPGKDLGMLRQPGHRFFYGTDEVEPLEPLEAVNL